MVGFLTENLGGFLREVDGEIKIDPLSIELYCMSWAQWTRYYGIF